MRETYQDQLEAISADLVDMSHLVGTAMAQATRALLDADIEVAEAVIEGDQRIDAANVALEEKCLTLIALQQPVATDLRVTISGLRISGSLERMGDLAAHVAKQARLRYPRHSIPDELRGTFERMGSAATAIVAKTGEVIESRDVGLAAEIGHHDDEVDSLHRELFSTVLDPAWSHGIEAAIDVTLLSRYYERYADHAVTIARRVVHIVTGEPYGSIAGDLL